MADAANTFTLTEFRRNTREHLRRLQRTGQALILTVAGKPAAVVHDAASYERIVAAAERAEAIEGTRRGLVSMKQGRGRPLQQVLEDIGRRYEGTDAEANGAGSHAVRGRHRARRRGGA